MKRQLIREIYASPESFGGKSITVGGWVRNLRDSKAFGFIDLNDGSYFKSIQVVFERDRVENYDAIAAQNVGAALVVTGILTLTPGAKQPFELRRIRLRLRARPHRITPSSPSAILWSTFASRRTCVREQICSPRCSACAPRLPMRSIPSSIRAASYTCIPPSSPHRMQKARARCSA